MASSSPHVLLYVDVNKTVIMHDPVQGKDLPHIVNDLLTERALGRVYRIADGEAEWQWDGRSVIDHDVSEQDEEGCVSYGAFLRAEFPTSRDPDIARRNKKLRKVLRQDFTSEGNAGHGLVNDHASLLKKLELPPANGADTTELVQRAGLDASPYFFMVPAFFRFVEHLHDRDIAFNLIFRTYGDDLVRIAQEFNCFCEGKHPFFPHAKMDGSGGSIDRRIHLTIDEETDATGPRFGTFYRADEFTALVMGTFDQPSKDDAVYNDVSFYKDYRDVRVVEGIPAIHRFLTEEWRAKQTTLAIRDFYPFWFRNCEDATTSKLLTLDPRDDSVHAIFFDDNILEHDAHIVDARNARDGSAIPFEQTKDVNLVRVEPLDVIRDEEYFARRFEEALHRRSADVLADYTHLA